jgi:pimeloyl-ACP methyl ester carboxylesterase
MLTEKSFDTGLVTINYAESLANGPPFVLLHGATASWQELTALITELEHHWQVYACDKRGHGKSGRAASYRAVDFFPDTAAFIKHHIGTAAVLLGHSGGAIAALGAAAQIPELIRAVILLDPPLYLRESSIKSNYAYAYFLGVYNILTHQRTAHAVFAELFSNIDEPGIRRLEEMIRLVDPAFVKVLLEDRYFEDLDTRNSLEQVTCPTLLLYGESEKGGVVRDRDVEFFLAHIPRGTAIQVKDAGHLLHMDQPTRVLELIGEFTERL